MAQNVNPTFVKTPIWAATQITTGTGSSVSVTVYTGGANGSKIPGFIATATTTAAFDVLWGVTSSATFYLHGTASIPAGAGSTNSLPSVNLFNSSNAVGLTVDSDGNPFLFLASSAHSLTAKMPATSSTWAAGTVVNLVVPSVGDF